MSSHHSRLWVRAQKAERESHRIRLSYLASNGPPVHAAAAAAGYATSVPQMVRIILFNRSHRFLPTPQCRRTAILAIAIGMMRRPNETVTDYVGSADWSIKYSDVVV